MAFEITGNGGGGDDFKGVVRRMRRGDAPEMAFQPGEKPHSLQVEQAVLAGILLSNDVLNEIEALIRGDDFFLPAHREIFEGMRSLGFKGTPIDLTTLASYLRETGKLDFVGGAAYLGQILNVPSSSQHAISYAQTVADLSWRRRILEVAEDCRVAALQAGDTREIASQVEKKVFSATQERKTTQLSSLADVLHSVVPDLEKRKDREIEVGCTTGIIDLDAQITSLRPGQLVVIAARPGMGKTSLAANIMVNVARRQRKNVLFFSLEMTREEVVERVIGGEALIESGKLRTGNLSDSDFKKIWGIADELQTAPLYIDDRSVVTPFDVLAQARKLNAQLNLENPGSSLDLIVVDYIQIMKAGAHAENRALEVAAITGGLKTIAKDLRVPVIALSQLNRESTKRPDARPQLSDLKDSGAIEADADVVMFIHRVQGPDTDSRAAQEAEIIVAKQRSGPTGMVKVTWLGSYTTFTNYSNAQMPEYAMSAPDNLDPGY